MCKSGQVPYSQLPVLTARPRSSVKRLHAVLVAVSDSQHCGWMDIEHGKVGLGNPQGFSAFIAGVQVATGRCGSEADGEFLANFAVIVGYDVVRVAVDTDEPSDLDGDAGFFL